MDRVTVFQKKAANRERERSANLTPPQANGWLQQMKESGAHMSFTDETPSAEGGGAKSFPPVPTVSETPTTMTGEETSPTQGGNGECDWESFLKLKTEQRKSAYALPMSNDGTFTSSYQQLLSKSSADRPFGHSTHNVVFAPSA